MRSTGSADRAPQRKKLLFIGLFVLVCLLGAVGLAFEINTSHLQSRAIPRHAAHLGHEVLSGASDRIRFPAYGPFDQRLGYTQLPLFSDRLTERGWTIEAQSRFSPELMEYTGKGLFAPYREKARAGLLLHDRQGAIVHAFRYPVLYYEAFEAIPPVVVEILLFIENRGLLDPQRPYLNPAVDWVRFSRAAFSRFARLVNDDLDTPGASTLATQIEKYRHSPDGITHSAAEKLRQMASGSVRAYKDGRETLQVRQNLVLDYLNTVPLSAAPRYGEVHGLGDGLRVWYGTDFDRVNQLLGMKTGEGPLLAEQGLALRQVVSLMVAHRRPSYYLGGGREALAGLTDSHLRLFAEAGLIDAALRDAALASNVVFRDPFVDPAFALVEADKGATMLRTRLSGLLGIPLYDLDRLDLTASATLDNQLQQASSDFLGRLGEPDFAREAGIIGHRLLSPQRLREVKYSFTLFERTPDGNRVRVQTDTTDQPFDINEGSKLELGSTAKLRVLATYLEIIAELHAEHGGKTPEALREIRTERQDVLTRWAIDYLIRSKERDLSAMLEAALERRYSASPAESFFTGGGMHTFNNFQKDDNSRHPTVREALQASINLPFVRLMRDLVRHAIYQSQNNTASLVKDIADERRFDYLSRFADREGQVFLRRFWRKYQGLTAQEMQTVLLDGLRPTADRLAATFLYLNPDADQADFSAFVRERLGANVPNDARLSALYRKYGPGNFDLPDQGYIARVHPLELWLVAYLTANPDATLAETIAASSDERQAVYRWLFRTRAKSAQDSRIQTMLEVEAFLDLHARWARLGYPFSYLVPSLATALGSSGDRPAALAELMGIIMNDGVRQPTRRLDRLHFATDTPYETVFAHRSSSGERVMAPEVATSLRNALSEVVEAGTARRLAGTFSSGTGLPMTIGGKTGTGDNRIVFVGSGRQVRATIALNRTATFVFYIGPRHFGTLTAYVTGPDAASFRFTSALPVQILKSMAPILAPYLEAEDADLRQEGGEEDRHQPVGEEAALLRTWERRFEQALVVAASIEDVIHHPSDASLLFASGRGERSGPAGTQCYFWDATLENNELRNEPCIEYVQGNRDLAVWFSRSGPVPR